MIVNKLIDLYGYQNVYKAIVPNRRFDIVFPHGAIKIHKAKLWKLRDWLWDLDKPIDHKHSLVLASSPNLGELPPLVFMSLTTTNLYIPDMELAKVHENSQPHHFIDPISQSKAVWVTERACAAVAVHVYLNRLQDVHNLAIWKPKEP